MIEPENILDSETDESKSKSENEVTNPSSSAPQYSINTPFSWYIVYVLPQQKVHRVIKELLSPFCRKFIREVIAPTQKTASWKEGGKKVERENLALNNYFFIESTEEINEYKSKIEHDAICRLQVWFWPEGAEEVRIIQSKFNEAPVLTSYNVGDWVLLPKLGLERVQILKISNDYATVNAWIMAGCDPVNLDVHIKDMLPSKEGWEE